MSGAREQRTKGPLSGMWRDKKTDLSFRIEDDETRLDIKFTGSHPFVREFSAELTRYGEKPDLFSGRLQATFKQHIPIYTRTITATHRGSGELEFHCPDWPDSKARNKTKTLNVLLVRTGDLPKSQFTLPTSTLKKPTKSRSRR